MNLAFKKLVDDAVLPTRSHDGDAGLDLYLTEDIVVRSGMVAIASTGLSVEIPYGYVGLVHPRSGLAFKHGVTVVNAPGTIDHGYSGEIKVALTLLAWDVYPHRGAGQKSVYLSAGDRIAQLVIQQVELPFPIEVNELAETIRGTGGFGSTGN